MSMDYTSEQRDAINIIGKNVSVSAGAGSGKTRVLVERFLHILDIAQVKKEPVDAASIGAITFTRKAAGEMRTRIRKGLLERQQKGDADKFWARQISALDRAHISTIDSLCSTILKENPVEAELDPGFTVTDELDLDIFQAQLLDKFLDEQFESKNPAVFQLFSQYGYESLRSQLLSLVDELPAICSEQDLSEAYRQRLASLPELKSDFLLAVRILSTNKLDFTKASSKSYKKLQDLELHFEQIETDLNRNPADFSCYLELVKNIRLNDAGKEQLLLAKECIAAINLLELDKKALKLMPAWQEILQSLGALMAAKQAELERLGFGDVARKALELLEKYPEVRKRYQNRFAYLMVDEFQDTNDQQRQLIYLLCGDSSQCLAGQKLFVVGDPKQSIYGFRGADVSVFKRVQQDIKATGGVNLQLSRNFRSLDKVLNFVNDTFEDVIGCDTKQDVVFEALDHEREGIEADKPVLFELQYDDSYDADVYGDKYLGEARNLVHTLAELHEQGQAYGEMAVLMRTMSKIQYVVLALQEADIPYDLVDGRGFYQQQEVLDLINLFTYLENPSRTLELVGILRSPYVGLTDAAITDAVFSEGGIATVVPTVISELVAAAKLLPLTLLWEEVWRRLEVEQLLLGQELGENKLANAKKLRQLAMEFAAQGSNGTLGSWIKHIRELRSADVKETTANLARTDCVTLMTIHKAKGLEYKTVFVPFLESSSKHDADMIAYKQGIGLGISVGVSYGNPVFGGTGGFEPSGVLSMLREAAKLKEHEEKARVLYVAMTRAEDRLFLSGLCKTDQKSSSDDERTIREKHSWFKQLRTAAEKTSAVKVVAKPLTEIVPLVVGRTETEEAAAQQGQTMEKLPHYKSWGRTVFSPSTLQAYEHCPRAFYYEALLGLPRIPASTGDVKESYTPASITGLVIHKTLELYQDATKAYEKLETAYQQAVKEESKGYDTTKAWEMLQAYVASEAGKSIPRKHKREQNFYYNAEDITLNGIIDCFYENADGTLTIVDYKTGTPPEPGEVKLGYAWQLAIYKAAVERMTRKTVKNCELHFLQNNSIWRLPEDSQYYEEAISICIKLLNAEAAEEFPCNLCNCQWCDYAYLCPNVKYT